MPVYVRLESDRVPHRRDDTLIWSEVIAYPSEVYQLSWNFIPLLLSWKLYEEWDLTDVDGLIFDIDSEVFLPAFIDEPEPLEAFLINVAEVSLIWLAVVLFDAVVWSVFCEPLEINGLWTDSFYFF